MKLNKLIVTIGVASTMVLASGIAAFAADTTTATPRTIVPTMTFSENVVSLSLDDTIKIMQTTGAGAQTAEYNMKKAKSIEEGYNEGYTTIKNALNLSSMLSLASQSAFGLGDVSESDKALLNLQRAYAKVQGPANFDAEMNKLEYDAVQTYYGVLQAQDNLKASNDNLKIQEGLLATTHKKYSLGLVAKKDVLAAQTAVTTAKSDVISAQNTLKNAKMNFNFQLGNSVMQGVTLTDVLKEITPPAILLEDAINSALDKRGEIRASELGYKATEIQFNSIKYRYPANASKYLSAQVAALQSEKAFNDSFFYIEMEVRSKFMDLETKKAAVDSARATVTNANEMYRLTNISYNNGLATLSDVQQAQLGAYRANQGLSAAITNYDLSIYAFKYATGAGVSPVGM